MESIRTIARSASAAEVVRAASTALSEDWFEGVVMTKNDPVTYDEQSARPIC